MAQKTKEIKCDFCRRRKATMKDYREINGTTGKYLVCKKCFNLATAYLIHKYWHAPKGKRKETQIKKMKIRIQPKERPDMVLPYPFFIEKKGLVGRQDFWKGKPLKLLGFSNSSQQGTMELMFADFWKKPKSAIGKYPVFAFKDDSWHTFGDSIDRIEITKK